MYFKISSPTLSMSRVQKSLNSLRLYVDSRYLIIMVIDNKIQLYLN